MPLLEWLIIIYYGCLREDDGCTEERGAQDPNLLCTHSLCHLIRLLCLVTGWLRWKDGRELEEFRSLKRVIFSIIILNLLNHCT